MNIIESVMNEYRVILTEIDEEWRRLAARYDFDCKKCGECCRGPVPVSRYVEALLLLENFAKLDALKQDEILRRARLYKLEAKRRGYPTYPSMPPLTFSAQFVISLIERDLHGIPCPLLSDENLCEFYDVRPVACRTYTCFDDYGSYWMRFHLRISELELRADVINWKTKFVADVLLLAEKI